MNVMLCLMTNKPTAYYDSYRIRTMLAAAFWVPTRLFSVLNFFTSSPYYTSILNCGYTKFGLLNVLSYHGPPVNLFLGPDQCSVGTCVAGVGYLPRASRSKEKAEDMF